MSDDILLGADDVELEGGAGFYWQRRCRQAEAANARLAEDNQQMRLAGAQMLSEWYEVELLRSAGPKRMARLEAQRERWRFVFGLTGDDQ